MTRSAADYQASLTDGRAVHLDGEIVEVATHRAFAGIVHTMGSLIDLSASPELRTVDGDMAWWWHTPRTPADLAARRRASETLASLTGGFVGRGPDHVASFFAGFVGHPEVFGERADAVTDFWRYAATHDQYVSYVIIPPSVDRARVAEGGERSQVRLVDQGPDGIVVRGAHILGTGTAVSDWLFVSCIPPLGPTDVERALSFVVPVATTGLRLHCRRPYGGQRNVDGTDRAVFDAPFSSRFDETDGVVVFDDVLVPWCQVFVCGDPAATAAQFHTTAAHTLGNLQAQIRLMVKLRFLVGLASRVIGVTGAAVNPVALDQLAELQALAASVEAHVLAAEHAATLQPAADGTAVLVPDKRFLYSAMSRQAELYPRALHLLRELTSSQVIDLPSSAATFAHPDLVGHATSPDCAAEERVKLFALAWDVIGSEFAGRHHQYEMFYAGAPAVAKAHTRRTWRVEQADALLDSVLEGLGSFHPCSGPTPGDTTVIELDVDGEVHRFAPDALIVAGYTGADTAVVHHHIEELAAVGIAPPPRVPMYWALPAWSLTQQPVISVPSTQTSGEVELALVVDGAEIFVAIGSDHTDRSAEAIDIGLSKLVCPTPISRRAWRWAEFAERWSDLQLSSTVEIAGRYELYQADRAGVNRSPADLLAGIPWAATPPARFVLLCGTVAVLGGIRPADRFTATVTDPAAGAELSLDYTVAPVPALR